VNKTHFASIPAAAAVGTRRYCRPPPARACRSRSTSSLGPRRPRVCAWAGGTRQRWGGHVHPVGGAWGPAPTHLAHSSRPGTFNAVMAAHVGVAAPDRTPSLSAVAGAALGSGSRLIRRHPLAGPRPPAGTRSNDRSTRTGAPHGVPVVMGWGRPPSCDRDVPIRRHISTR
jgi:hypothetical protein